MIYGEILKIITFYHFDSDPRFLPFLLYVRCKSGVTFVRRCFCDVKTNTNKIEVLTDLCIHHMHPADVLWILVKPGKVVP